jgi:hypothetical protein
MIKFVFNIVAKLLIKLSSLTGFTYNEINIIVYYFIIPFTWLVLLDVIFQSHILKLAFVVFCFGFYIGCRDFRNYSNWLFNKSVIFLNYFNKLGSNYYASSVWICVTLPLLIYVLLIFIIIKKQTIWMH